MKTIPSEVNRMMLAKAEVIAAREEFLNTETCSQAGVEALQEWDQAAFVLATVANDETELRNALDLSPIDSAAAKLAVEKWRDLSLKKLSAAATEKEIDDILFDAPYLEPVFLMAIAKYTEVKE